MRVVRLPKGQIAARLVLTRSGDWIHAVISVKRPMQEISEIGDYESVEKAETHALGFAERLHVDVLYIDDRT